MKKRTPRPEWPPIIGKIIDVKIKEIDTSEVQFEIKGVDEMITEIKERFKFEDDKTEMVKIINNLLKSHDEKI